MIEYLFDIKDKENLINYFKFKNKHDYFFSEEELNEFLILVKKEILKLNNNNNFDLVLIPQSSNVNLKKLALIISKNIVIIEKNSISYIKEKINEQNLQKAEKLALMKSIDEMNQDLKMAEIKANQRKRFEKILYKEVEVKENSNTLLLDDGLFSGYTMKALENSCKNINKKIVLFSK